MNNILFLFFLMSLVVCDNNRKATLTGKWKLIKYHNLALGTSETEPRNISRSIIIEFSDNGHIGKMNGHTVTNSISGEYELLNKNGMKTLSFGGTEMGEPGWGNKFWSAINIASLYERHDNKFFIFFNADSKKMEFKKEYAGRLHNYQT